MVFGFSLQRFKIVRFIKVHDFDKFIRSIVNDFFHVFQDFFLPDMIPEKIKADLKGFLGAKEEVHCGFKHRRDFIVRQLFLGCTKSTFPDFFLASMVAYVQ